MRTGFRLAPSPQFGTMHRRTPLLRNERCAMPRCYSYIRFSSKKQEEGDSLKRQRELRDQWIATHKGCFLDEELPPLEDLGVSAMRGDNLNPEEGALGRFVQLCKAGKIERGSYLILEHLDRFSRDDAYDVAKLFKDLVKVYGLTIVVLTPSETIIDRNNINNMEMVLVIVLQFQMAYEYSRNLSRRLKASWKSRREQARTGVRLTSKMIPSWLKIDQNGDFKVSEHAKEAIDFIYSEVINGTPQKSIVRLLNENFKPITKPAKLGKAYWSPSYVCRLIQDRRLLGEMQMYKKNDQRKNVPDGEPIKNYFPKLIDEDTFYKAQAARNSNKRFPSNKPSGEITNLFRGLIECMSDGYPMFVKRSHSRRNGKIYKSWRLMSYGTKINTNACKIGIDYKQFERLVLIALSEIRAKDIREISNQNEEIKDLERVVLGIEGRLRIIQEKLLDDELSDDFESLLSLERELKLKLLDRKERLETLNAVEQKPKKETIAELRHLNRTRGDKDKSWRRRYANLIPQLISKIYVLPLKYANNKTGAWGVIKLRSGQKRLLLLRRDMSAPNAMFYDNQRLPIWIWDKGGHIFYEVDLKNRNPGPNGRIEIAGYRCRGQLTEGFRPSKIMEALNKEISDATVHGSRRPPKLEMFKPKEVEKLKKEKT